MGTTRPDSASPTAGGGTSPFVVLERDVLAVLVGELSKRPAFLDAATRSALASATASLGSSVPAPAEPAPSTAAVLAARAAYAAPAAPTPTPPPPEAPAPARETLPTLAMARHDARCSWRADPEAGTWTCAHGEVRHTHPNGYCDEGCCR